MKKLFAFIFAVLLVLNNYAQITIADYSDYDLTNKTSLLPADEEYHFDITNEGSSSINFIIEVISYTIPADAGDMLVCGGGTCVQLSLISAFPSEVGTPTSLNAGETWGAEGNTHDEVADVNYISNSSSGQATITIKVYEEGNESNFTEFTLDTDYVGVNNINKNNLISVYPNPATDYFTISIPDELNNSQIVFTNILGKIVSKNTIKNTEQTFSTESFSKGIYFYSIINNNKIIETKKLIVK